jgi:hypothetical protein
LPDADRGDCAAAIRARGQALRSKT